MNEYDDLDPTQQGEEFARGYVYEQQRIRRDMEFIDSVAFLIGLTVRRFIAAELGQKLVFLFWAGLSATCVYLFAALGDSGHWSGHGDGLLVLGLPFLGIWVFGLLAFLSVA